MMDLLTTVWDSIYALAVGMVAGILVQRVGMVDWLLEKLMRK